MWLYQQIILTVRRDENVWHQSFVNFFHAQGARSTILLSTILYKLQFSGWAGSMMYNIWFLRKMTILFLHYLMNILVQFSLDKLLQIGLVHDVPWHTNYMRAISKTSKIKLIEKYREFNLTVKVRHVHS